PPVTAIKAGTLIDGTGGAPVKNAVILIQGDRITAVGANVAVPRGATVIDLSAETVLPGFIDAHVHLVSRTIGDGDRQHSRRVAAHAHGTAGIKAAVRAGVTSIEHGSLLDSEAVALMKEHGTYLVPTLLAGFTAESLANAKGLPPVIAAKALQVAARARQSFKMAVGAGVKIALGTDAGVMRHGTNGREFD